MRRTALQVHAAVAAPGRRRMCWSRVTAIRPGKSDLT